MSIEEEPPKSSVPDCFLNQRRSCLPSCVAYEDSPERCRALKAVTNLTKAVTSIDNSINRLLTHLRVRSADAIRKQSMGG